MRRVAHTHAHRPSRIAALGALLVVVTAGGVMAEPGTHERHEPEVTLTSVVDVRPELSLADIYAGYADADTDRAELSLADIYAGYADADTDRPESSLADIYAGYADAEPDDGASSTGPQPDATAGSVAVDTP